MSARKRRFPAAASSVIILEEYKRVPCLRERSNSPQVFVAECPTIKSRWPEGRVILSGDRCFADAPSFAGLPADSSS